MWLGKLSACSIYELVGEIIGNGSPVQYPSDVVKGVWCLEHTSISSEDDLRTRESSSLDGLQDCTATLPRTRKTAKVMRSIILQTFEVTGADRGAEGRSQVT